MTDIKLFVEKNSSKLYGVRGQDQIVANLSRAGSKHGIFLLVALQLEAILTVKPKSEQETIGMLSSFKSDLESTYNSQIDRFRTRNMQQYACATRTLSWIYYATRPLLVNELRQILDFEFKIDSSLYADKSLLDVCMGLVVKADTTNVVSFTHFSLHEFLTMQHHSYKSPPGSEITIAHLCLLFLLQDDLAQEIQTLDDLKFRTQRFPFYTYAAKFWGFHFQRAYTNWSPVNDCGLSRSEFIDLALRFLKDEHRVDAANQVVFSSEGAETISSNGLIESTALHLVAHFGLDWAVDELLSQSLCCGKPWSQDSWERTPLHIAAAGGFDICVPELIQNLRDADREMVGPDRNGRTVWHHAAIGGSLKVANVLKRTTTGEGPKLMHRDGFQKTPLEVAAHYGFTDFVDFLLEDGFDNLGDIELDDIDIAMTAALNNGQSGVVKVLLDHGAPLADKYLLTAVKSGLESSVWTLILYGASVDAASSSGETALHMAIVSGKSSILRLLSGANLEAKDGFGQTPLASAVEIGDSEAVRFLLRAGADKKALMKGGQSMITYVVSKGMVELLQIFPKEFDSGEGKTDE